MMKTQNYKSKATKDKNNYRTSGSNELSDFIYTTESHNMGFDYRYGGGPQKYNDYDDYYPSKYFGRYNPKNENIDFEGYTSATSYSERNQRRPSPGSKSEKIYSQRYSNSLTRQRRKNQSPNRDYETMEETSRGSRQKDRARFSLESASEQTVGHRPKSTRKRDGSYMYDDLSYEKYFEPAENKPRQRSLESSEKRRRMQERAEKELKVKKRQKSPKQQSEYQVYAYEDDKPHERVFMRRTKVSENSPLVSEIELKTHDYPVLAFKDRNTIDAKDSDMVYVPVLVVDKSNKIKYKTVPPVKRSPARQGDLQVYAANLENKNLFETMGDTNYKNTLPGSHNRQSLIEQNQSQMKNSALNGESQVESILNQTIYSSRQSDGKYSRETRATENPSFGNNQKSMVYQVNEDGASEVKKESNRMSQTRKSTRDHLHDDYPVTKDYIKVNDGEERKSFVEKLSSFVTPTRQSTKPETRNPSVFVDIITNDKIAHSITDSKDATRQKSIVKGSFATKNPSIIVETSPKRSINVGNQNMLEESSKRSLVEAKSGSMAIPSDIPREDGAEIKNSQGVTSLSNAIDGADKQSPTRQSTKEQLVRQPTKEHLVRQSTVSPISRKSTVLHTSAKATMATAKNPSISQARPSQTVEKKLSAIQSRPSLAKPQNLSSTQIAERIQEPRKSLAKTQVTNDPKPQTMSISPIEVTSKELRTSLAQNQQEVTASLGEQRKSKFSNEPEVTTPEPKQLSKVSNEPEVRTPEPKQLSKSRTSTQQIEESQEDLKEFTKAVFHVDYAKEPSLKNVSLGQNDGVASRMMSEVKPDDRTQLNENAEQADLRKSQALARESKEPRVLSSEKITSGVNFSQYVEDNKTPSSKYVQNNEETTPSIKLQPSQKSYPNAEETRPQTAQSSVRPQESKNAEEGKPTINKPASQKPETSNKQKKLASNLCKNKSQSSHKGVGDTPSKSLFSIRSSKSLVSKGSKKSVAKKKKPVTKKASSRSIFGILKKSKSNLSNKSMDRSQKEPPTEIRQEQQATKEKQPDEPKPCDCVAHVKNLRECCVFFLGTTLHEQAMKMLQVIC